MNEEAKPKDKRGIKKGVKKTCVEDAEMKKLKTKENPETPLYIPWKQGKQNKKPFERRKQS